MGPNTRLLHAACSILLSRAMSLVSCKWAKSSLVTFFQFFLGLPLPFLPSMLLIFSHLLSSASQFPRHPVYMPNHLISLTSCRILYWSYFCIVSYHFIFYTIQSHMAIYLTYHHHFLYCAMKFSFSSTGNNTRNVVILGMKPNIYQWHRRQRKVWMQFSFMWHYSA